MFQRHALLRSATGLLLLALSASTLAQETCGVTVVVFDDGFETGSLPGYTPPADSTPLAMSVTFPNEGATVGSERIVLAGTYSGPSNIGITVNGQLAATTNTAFISRPITLATGANAINVQLHSIDGPGPSVVRNVTYNPAAAPQVSLDPLIVSTPIPGYVQFAVTQPVGAPLTLTRVQLDFNGDGSPDVDTPNGGNVSFVYQLPGLYTVTGTATLDDTDPGTPPVQVPLTTRALAEHPMQVRFALCSLFGTMRTRLAAQNISGALSALSEHLRPGYQAMWTSIGAQLPAVAAQLGTIVDGVFSPQMAEYVLARPIAGQPGQSRAYRVQFERTELGVWRISAM